MKYIENTKLINENLKESIRFTAIKRKVIDVSVTVLQEAKYGEPPKCIDCGAETKKRLGTGIYECPNEECSIIEMYTKYPYRWYEDNEKGEKINVEGYYIYLVKRKATPRKRTL